MVSYNYEKLSDTNTSEWKVVLNLDKVTADFETIPVS